MSRISPVLFSLALSALLAWGAQASAVTVPPIFSDHMVLQRDSMAAIWGAGRPGEEISATGSWGAEASATTDDDGRWQLRLPTPSAGGPYRVEISGDQTVTLSDVLIGEVWFAAGQSNMEMKLPETAPVEDWEGALALSKRVRIFDVANRMSVHPQRDCAGEWFAASAANAPRISAVAYHHAALLERDLQVPIGVITSDWGGTRLEAWLSAAAAAKFPEPAQGVELLQQLRDPSRRTAVSQDPEAWWRHLDDGSWLQDAAEAPAWEACTMPALFDGDLAGFDGLVYLRKFVDLPSTWSGGVAELRLGPVDDYDDVWINGAYLGGEHKANRWNHPRVYTIPDGVLHPGTNVVCVRVLDTGGLGGFHGVPADLALQREGGDPVTLAGDWQLRRGQSVGELPERRAPSRMHPNIATVLHNGMVAPVAPYCVRGAIWYQGESNRSNASEYEQLMAALIADWRRLWGAEKPEDFPFYFVQIAPYEYDGPRGVTAALREAQLAAATRNPHVGMAVTLDLGNYGDIHPKQKRRVGQRLARWALHDAYGRAELVPCGPQYRAAQVNGAVMRVEFDHVGAGLDLRRAARHSFMIAGEDRQFFLARARVDGDALIVSSPDVAAPAAVRYCWDDTPEPSLFNRDGLPASPFRTDDWPELDPPVSNERQVRAHRSDDVELRSLFNGTDLTGWVNVNCAPSTWQVRDGMIVCSGKPTGVLRTTEQYENFVLELEYRHLQPRGNAGVFVWSDPVTARGQPFTRSVEVQVIDGHESSWYTSHGDIFPIHGASMVPRNGRGGSRAFPTDNRAYRAPLWNHYRIVCQDGSVSLAVNGEEVTRGDRCSPRKGYLCLESEGSEVHFRNVRLKQLPPSSPPLPPTAVAAKASGFRSLYNGVDLAGWKSVAGWSARDWVLRFDGTGTDLWSDEVFADFELICDWRWVVDGRPQARPVIGPDGLPQLQADGEPRTATVTDAGDSGIYLRGSSKSQVNIWCWPIGSGEVYGYRTDAAQPADVRSAVTPRSVADAPIGKWNRFEIVMRGERLTVQLNGITVIDDARLPGVAASGPIALQAHGAPIEFANIYIKALRQF